MAVIATGFFDGVHLGHRLVIDTLVSEARRRGEDSVILTFWPHPRTVLQKDARELRLLSSQNEKIELLRAYGVSHVEVLPFTREFASLTAAEYIRTVLHSFDCSRLVLGYDTRLGSDQLGPEQIHALYPDSVIVPPFYEKDASIADSHGLGMDMMQNSSVISSTRIRRYIEVGAVDAAARLLGRPYELSGVVVSGNQLGRTIGFPTANMQVFNPLKAIPERGVYFVEVETLGRRLHGMTNIGIRPTVSESAIPTIETNIFDFDEMIYGLELRIRFIRRIRDEHRFTSVDELRSQLGSDRSVCMNLIS